MKKKRNKKKIMEKNLILSPKDGNPKRNKGRKNICNSNLKRLRHINSPSFLRFEHFTIRSNF